MRNIGTTAKGVRTPIISSGDNIVDVVIDSMMKCVENKDISFRDRDIIGITEAVVGRAQGNFATTDQIAKDVKSKIGSNEAGVIFPIFSRNRFSVCLKGIARALDKIYLQLSFPSDEVGNHLFDKSLLENSGINPYTDIIDEKTYREKFGYATHKFTGVDYVAFYKELIEAEGCEAEVVFANNPTAVLDYTNNVIACDIHTRFDTKKALLKKEGVNVLLLSDILTDSVDGSGYHEEYGLLGSNKATEQSVKLFPRDCQTVVDEISKQLKDKTGKNVEVIIYGDGAFKDPVGKIWELADPVVGVAYTKGLEGVPSEVKLKYIADNTFSNLHGEELNEAMRDYIKNKSHGEINNMEKEGTTPRQLTDLIGSLCDLVSGSGDKGTPVVYISGYFDDYSTN